MEAAGSSEMSVPIYWTIWHHIPGLQFNIPRLFNNTFSTAKVRLTWYLMG
jgi:hypothetical protein